MTETTKTRIVITAIAATVTAPLYLSHIHTRWTEIVSTVIAWTVFAVGSAITVLLIAEAIRDQRRRVRASRRSDLPAASSGDDPKSSRSNWTGAA
jgi:hypothetical protein